MQRTKVYIITGTALIAISILLHAADTVNRILAMTKCLTLAYGILLLTTGILSYLRVRRRNAVWLYGIGLFIMGCYTLIAVDTYIFHVMDWFPGIIRYPLFSLYGIGYLIFIVPSIFLYIGRDTE